MYWFDSMLVTPVVGVKFIDNFPAAFHYREKIISNFKKKSSGEGTEVNIAKDNPIAFLIKHNSGFQYEIKPDNFVVSYSYIVNQIKQAGSLPTLETTELKPYTELLTKTIDDSVGIWKDLNEIDRHQIVRIGIMAVCSIEKSAIPPGIDEFIKHLGSLWEQGLGSMEGNISANLDVSDEKVERCHHILNYNPSESDEVNFKLDYQILYSEPLQVNQSDYANLIKDSSEKALAYFEKFGAGELNYG